MRSILKNKYFKITIITIITLGIFAIASIFSIYQTEFYHNSIWSFLGPSDNRFHMMRIEGLYQSILRHDYFPVINMSFMDGFGYISNIFYSDFLLYPVALMKLLGYSTAQAIARYYVILNFLTFGVSFLCFYKVQRKYWNSLVFSFVYTLSSYRLHDLLFRHDLGEVGAFLFLPIAMLGIYEIFYGERKRNWLFLTFGMTGIIYSHALSPVLVAILIVIVALCQIPELKLHPKRLLSLLWAAICSGLLSIGYFLPMLEQLKHTTFQLTKTKSILVKGSSSLQDSFNWSLSNIIDKPNIGLILLIASVIIIVSAHKIQNKAIRHFSIIGVAIFIFSTSVFPWILLNKTPFKMIQYTWRFDMITTLLLAIFVASDPLNIFKVNTIKGLLIAFVLLLSISASYRLIQSYSAALIPYSEYNKMSPYSIGGGQEYLPVGTNINTLERTKHQPKITSGKAKITDFKQTGTKLTFNFKNAKDTEVNLPIIGYYGFQSKDSIGQVSKLTMDKQHNNLAKITINGKGKVVVDYYETKIQKSARHFSAISLIIMILIMIAYPFRNKLKPLLLKLKPKNEEKPI
ncbi:hypothetical protein [Companilactobacillus futsaii]|uniref:YfhO family protein n=2 Tax=Companilactobacillus futsaii TaxID=938155 RepID=A0A5B7SW40_9LACO|nr:hypothetical protein [Companilactobacillus futsaii]KRK95291.1 cell surface protein precursor [Companilactobacillus futsaii JCM 17355]QCX23908.1 YfhO family protein [Companilactobacillus futsaii]